jgi:addiction module RelB/DinJ family antitoxin
MAAKTANVLARVEPDVKEQAEAILSKLGIPVSTAINMLYKQIIMTRSIPFSLTVPAAPIARDEMDDAMFHAMMQEGMKEAKAGNGVSVEEAFTSLREEIG